MSLLIVSHRAETRKELCRLLTARYSPGRLAEAESLEQALSLASGVTCVVLGACHDASPDRAVARLTGEAKPDHVPAVVVVAEEPSEAERLLCAGADVALPRHLLCTESLWLAVEHALACRRLARQREPAPTNQERWRSHREQLRLAAQAARVGTYDYDVERQVSYWSSELGAIFGVPGQRQAKADDLEAYIHPDDRARLRRLVEEATDPSGRGYYQREYRIQRPDGTVRWVCDCGQTFFEGEGEARRAVRVVGLFQDITDRKEAERTLQEADRKKDEFLATLAHELRNPLAPLKSGLQLLELAPNDRSLLTRTTQGMRRQLDQLVRLVDDLTDLSRITRGRLELRRAPTSLEDFVQAALAASRHLLEAKGHRVSMDLHDPQLLLEVDGVRMTQVVANLLNNAAKYTPAGGNVQLISRLEDGQLQLSVIDDGPGIPPGMQQRIFDMFTQGEAAETGSGGLGLGLTLVRSLVEMHGGSVQLRQAPSGQGSEFVVRLPQSLVKRRSKSGVHFALPSRPGMNRRVLVVDDNHDFLSMLSLNLQGMGSEVRTARNGREALEAGEAFRPHLVLMDLQMPTLNGFDAARALRCKAWGRSTKLMALTGWTQPQDLARTREAGFDGHLVKPPSMTELEALLREVDLKQVLAGQADSARRG